MNNTALSKGIVFRNTTLASSIIEARSVVITFAISALYHLVLLLIVPDTHNMQTTLPEFWVFVLSDIAIWTLGLIPLFAVWHKRLSWYDPFFLFWAMIFGTFFTVFLAVCLDPFSAASWMSFGASTALNPAKGSFYLNLFQAEIIIFLFLLIMLLTNQKIIKYSLINRKVSKRASLAAIITGIILSILGIYGFFYYWGERSFLETVLSANGTFIPELGTARFLLFQGLASTAIPLGLIGWLSATGRRSKERVVKINWLVLVVIFCTLLPHFVTGSRLNILIAMVSPIAALRFFNFSIGRRMLGITVIALIVFGFAVTIIRGNEYTKWVSQSAATFSLSEAIDNYTGQHRSISQQLLYADRVGNIAFIVRNLNKNNEYLYGQSLIAGLGNYVADFLARLRGKQLLEKPFLMANQYITKWRFGDANAIAIIGGPVPPSVEGEFFMQGGYIALIILSYLLGRSFFLLRQKIALTRSMVMKWFLIECLILMGFYFTMGEVSSFSLYLLYLIVVVVVYKLIFLLINANKGSPINV